MISRKLAGSRPIRITTRFVILSGKADILNEAIADPECARPRISSTREQQTAGRPTVRPYVNQVVHNVVVVVVVQVAIDAVVVAKVLQGRKETSGRETNPKSLLKRNEPRGVAWNI